MIDGDPDDLRSHIRDVPDFPQPGVLFRDITPLLADAAALRRAITGLADALRASGGPPDRVAGIEARGFVVAAPLALELGVGFVPVRKPGKLPAETVREDYDLEYGTDALEVHADACAPGERILVVDDVLATGGTAAAATRLLRGVGAEVTGLGVLIELTALGGRSTVGDLPVTALLSY
ncbi:MAG: adenine phosphoribosyltransferase [Acidimicrobiales bacterium]|nr:adenine phosphoribosyltransferase [Acidimicrobiales bacterium]